MQRFIVSVLFLGLVFQRQIANGGVIDFEDLSLSANRFYNGDSGIGTNSNGWSSGGASFGNSFDSSFGGFWNGWSYSNVNNTTTAGFTNQYAAYTGTGIGGTGNYAVGFQGSHSFINLGSGQTVESIQVTNTTYAALSMLNGDSFSKKFGGPSGNDADFFRVTFTGYEGLNATGNTIGTTELYLADFRSANNAQDYVVATWEQVDLTGIRSARSIGISFASSDVGIFGINTPTFVAIDNLSIAAVPEPASLAMLSVIAVGSGFCVLRSRRRRLSLVVAMR